MCSHADEQRLLRRRGAGWSDGDVPLLDEAHALAGTPPRTFDHVIVDEAQDLTPMQLRMIARRARGGALTILGDVAQGTGAVTYESWDEILPHLPRGGEAAVEELRHAYRVPREIMELSLPLLDVIAPRTERPLAYRVGGAEPILRRVPAEELVREAYHEAARLAAARRPRRADRPRRAARARAGAGERLRGDRAADAAPGEGPRVRPRDRRRAGARGRPRAGATRALRRAHAADADARRRLLAPAARRAPGRCVEWRACRSCGHPGMAGPLDDLVARIHRRIEAFAQEHGVEAMVEVELSDGALYRLVVALAGARLRLRHARAAVRGGRAAGADRPARRRPPAHAEPGRAAAQDRLLAPGRAPAK